MTKLLQSLSFMGSGETFQMSELVADDVVELSNAMFVRSAVSIRRSGYYG